MVTLDDNGGNPHLSATAFVSGPSPANCDSTCGKPKGKKGAHRPLRLPMLACACPGDRLLLRYSVRPLGLF